VATWQAARNGFPGDTSGTDKSAHVNQHLATHPQTVIYQGNRVVTPSAGTGVGVGDPIGFWQCDLSQHDYDVPFPLSGDQIGRIGIPLLPMGDGADLQVSLYTDSGGAPGTLLNTIRVPAKWINAFSAIQGISATSSGLYLEPTDSPLALPQYNDLRYGAYLSYNWKSAAVGANGGAANGSCVQSGNYFISLGGNTGGTNPVVTGMVFVNQWLGGTDASSIGPPVPQPSLPVPTEQPGAACTPDYLVVAGGLVGGVATSNVFVASWDSNTGKLESWTAQAALPQALVFHACASWGETVYVVGGHNLNTVYYATVQNGQITAWNTGPPLPMALEDPIAAVTGNLLVVAGGITSSGSDTTACYYANINADGSLGGWNTGPSLPLAVDLYPGTNPVGLSTPVGGGIMVPQGSNGPNMMSLSAGPSGLSTTWQGQTATNIYNPIACFQSGLGQWQMYWFFAANFVTSTIYQMPRISVPLPTDGLRDGATYHLVLAQQGGDANNYLRSVLDHQVFPGNPVAQTRARGGSGTWTAVGGFYQDIPIQVFDLTANSQPWHTWEDGGNRITTLAYATTPDARLLGVAESTALADGSLNASAAAVNYSAVPDYSSTTWPSSGLWPPTGVTEL